MVERPTTQQHVERSASQWAQQSRPGYAAPKIFQRGARPVDAVVGIAIDQHRRIHRPRRGAGDTIDAQPGFLKQAVEHAPGERAMRAAALQREIHEKRRAARFHGARHPRPRI